MESHPCIPGQIFGTSLASQSHQHAGLKRARTKMATKIPNLVTTLKSKWLSIFPYYCSYFIFKVEVLRTYH
ncbi:uncharacterized protein CANTADRAFT_27401 [Suhomyces tanzawaensis NRRL Y-17324]|uniref:Uncharacterized protein n=1 Tax=Suhomyces tanzawaensis NRRL Y-17324 TaxID=984487 RepID=A0A1E4SBQ9_9ASCO|nr:uncharacterized protein CANTADRAFT_27401 [Suhomyces tanzawaensis NRRL Y-17324]ODV76970.1 hypothetical protein CANTADRAFT_27401 [Suhomyces tanzawaensis NRRL Y-17324]